jgi:hypothetical protein
MDEMLTGTDSNSIRRRNALVNSLAESVPQEEKRTVINSARSCLYALAPGVLWQFFSGQGLSGSKKTSLADALPHIYKALIVSLTLACNCTQKNAGTAISEVLKGLYNRRESKSFRDANPQEAEKHTRHAFVKPQTTRDSTISSVNSESDTSSDDTELLSESQLDE